MSTAPPPKPLPPPAKRPTPTPAIGSSPARSSLSVSRGVVVASQKIVIYGPGGIGKTKLASLIPMKTLFIDLESGSGFLEVDRITPTTFDELRSSCQNQDFLSEYDCFVFDSLTKAEELATTWTLDNVPHEKGHHVTSVEGYGFGKGTTHVYETFLKLLGDMDTLARRGKTIVAICHECTANVPNPGGEDWIRYEPRLQSPASGKSSIRHRVKEWADHLFYIGYDVAVDKQGKASGAGTRCIYPQEMPTHWAKSRSLAEPIVYEDGSAELWNQLLKTRS